MSTAGRPPRRMLLPGCPRPTDHPPLGEVAGDELFGMTQAERAEYLHGSPTYDFRFSTRRHDDQVARMLRTLTRQGAARDLTDSPTDQEEPR